MKRTFTLLSFIALFAGNAFSQACGTVGTDAPDENATFSPLAGSTCTDIVYLSPTPATTPCAVKGTPYYQVFTFKIPHDITCPEEVTVDSALWISVSNLPCGLCWTVNKESKLYANEEFGTITISGTTDDVAGQYDLEMIIKAKLAGENQWEANQDASLANFYISIRVQEEGGECAAYTTNPGRNAGCVTSGIKTVSNPINSIAITPNPMNNSALLSFVSEKGGKYSMTVMDILGKTVSVQNINTVAGYNETKINRGNLPQGVYFVNISNGQSRAVKKFIIAE